MADETGIDWTDSTHNEWIGCSKVSPGCRDCYAEHLMDHRMGRARWGPGQPRSLTAEGNRAKPFAWNRAAAKSGIPRFVFSSSLSDVWDHEVPEAWRDGLRETIAATPHLQWLLLTKRHEQMAAIWPRWLDAFGEVPANVWLGVTVEDQERADERIPVLARMPAAGRFLSVEPLIGPVRLRLNAQADFGMDPLCELVRWVIVGGESRQGDAHEPRPMHPEWVRALRDECAGAFENVAFWFKQWGDWKPHHDATAMRRATDAGKLVPYTVAASTARSEVGSRVWHAVPSGVREDGPGPVDIMRSVGAKAAGQVLDGITHRHRPPATAGGPRPKALPLLG